MNRNPLVSIIIPTYNYEKYICEAVDSILTSNFPSQELEIIIVDDGSTDETADRIKHYSDKVNYIYQDNNGKAQATRVAIEHSNGQYILNLDADDVFLPNKIQEVVRIFESDPDIVHVGHPALFWNLDDNIQKLEPIPNIFLGKKTLGKTLISYFYRTNTQFGGGSTFAIRREAAKRFAIPKEVDMYIDEYILLMALTQGYSFLLENPLSLWRIHGNNFSHNQSAKKLKLRRSLTSMQAIYNQLETFDLEEDILKLYQLKVLAFSLLTKEAFNEKTTSDVLDLISFFFRNISYFGFDTWEIIQGYKIPNRLLPTHTITFLKQLRTNYTA